MFFLLYCHEIMKLNLFINKVTPRKSTKKKAFRYAPLLWEWAQTRMPEKLDGKFQDGRFQFQWRVRWTWDFRTREFVKPRFKLWYCKSNNVTKTRHIVLTGFQFFLHQKTFSVFFFFYPFQTNLKCRAVKVTRLAVFTNL